MVYGSMVVAVSRETLICSYCGSMRLAVGRDGFLTCEDCGTVLDAASEAKPEYTFTQRSHVLQSLSDTGVAPRALQEAERVCEHLVRMGFRDQAYFVVPLVFLFGMKPSEAASRLGMPEALAKYAVYSFLDGVPLDMSYGPKVFMPLRKIELPAQLKVVRLKLHSEGGSVFVDYGGRVPLKPLYAGVLAMKNPSLRPTITGLLAVKTRRGVVLCADLGCIPKELPIKKRFYEALRGGRTLL